MQPMASSVRKSADITDAFEDYANELNFLNLSGNLHGLSNSSR